ncbi:MAG: hypothetical protein GY906_14390 [bacterium]|nr:hypothetical protein [bacterium]
MLSSVLLALALQSASAASIALSSIEPASIEPYQSVVLEAVGQGFSLSCKVMIDKRGRFVPIKTEYVNATRLRAVLAAGIGPEPATRQIVVKCGGRRSPPVAIEVAAVSIPQDEDEEELSSEDACVDADAEPEIPVTLPVAVKSLDPSSVAAGEVFTLTLMGSGFVEGVKIEILANLNAGTSRTPQYEIVEFEAEFASDSVLIVDFDRGFAASPRLRPVVATNPDGGQSLPVYLKITRRSP